MKKHFLLFLLLAALLAGCTGQGEASPMQEDDESSVVALASSSAAEAFPWEEEARQLLEEYIIPYEAIAGGGEAITTPAVMEAFSYYRALQEPGADTEAGIPRQTLEEYCFALFGEPLPAEPSDPGQKTAQALSMVYRLTGGYDDSLLWYQEESGTYTSEWIKADLEPAYTVTLKDVQAAEDRMSLLAGRSLEDGAFPDVRYDFIRLSDGGWRLEAVQPQLTEEFTHISTAEQLIRLGQMVNSGDCTYLSAPILQEADLDLSGVELEPIGVRGRGIFAGSFDGQGHTISHLSMDRVTYGISDLDPTGLFGVTASSARLQNLHLSQVDIRGGSYTGGLAGSFSGGMYHCSVTGRVEGFGNAGGLAGYAGTAELVDCHADTDVTGASYVGGLCGSAADGWYEACTASGTVTAVTDPRDPDVPPHVIGGLVGHQQGSAIRCCFADTTVRTQTASDLVGNLVGLSEYASIARCYVSEDAGGAWDAVDDDYGGVTDVQALPWAEYDRLLAQTIPADGSYEKQNGVFADQYNSKLPLTGAVDFDGDTLAVLISHPTEEMVQHCQGRGFEAYGGGKGAYLLLPVQEGTEVSLMWTRAGTESEYAEMGGWHVWTPAADESSSGWAYLLDLSGDPFDTGDGCAALEIQRGGRRAVAILDSSQTEEKMTYFYLKSPVSD